MRQYKDVEISATKAASLIGQPMLLLLHPMNVGVLPVRVVGNRRMSKLREVMRLTEKIDRQKILRAQLADEGDRLTRRFGLQA